MAHRLDSSGDPTSEDRYAPRLTEAQIEVVESWHKQAYASLRHREPGVANYLGLRLDIPAEVFPTTPVSDLLGRAVLRDVCPTDRVLDMGTGRGVNVILAATTARDVVGVAVIPSLGRLACRQELQAVTLALSLYPRQAA